MATEAEVNKELPQDYLKDTALDLLYKVSTKLQDVKGYRDAVIERFFDRADAKATPDDPLSFENNGVEYKLILKKTEEEDEILIFTVNEGVGEIMQIRLSDNPVLCFDRIDPESSFIPIEQYKNNSEAVIKIRQFIHQI